MKAKLSIYKAVQAAVIARVCHDEVEGPQPFRSLSKVKSKHPMGAAEVIRLRYAALRMTTKT